MSAERLADPRGVDHSQSSARLLTAEDLAERWGVTKAQVYRLARDGRIPTVPIGRYYRFRLAAIEAWEIAVECESTKPSGGQVPRQ
jgi:excisionase family DNA binding protein